MRYLTVVLFMLSGVALSACGGGGGSSDGSDGSDALIPGIKVNANLQAISSTSEE